MTHVPFSPDTVLESLGDGFQAFDRQWHTVYLNHRAEQALRCKREDLLDKIYWDVYPELQGTDLHRNCHEAMKSGKPLLFEVSHPHEKKWTEYSLHPYSDGLGIFTRDITERRRAEEALRQYEQQYHALFDQVQNAVLLADDNGNYVEANPAACSLFGLPCEELIGKSMVDFAPSEVSAQVKKSWRSFLQTGHQTGEFMLQLQDGAPRMLEYRARANVRPGIHISILRDVTDQRRAEKQAQYLLQDLREERDTLDTVNRIGRLLSAELDLKKLVQAATDAARELSGAQFGAFFYNVIDHRGEAYTLYTISGVPQEAFSQFPQPRATPLFGPTFRGEKTIRSGDITKDKRYGKMDPHFGMPYEHLPVCSYLAVPVVSRSGEVLGGLFFGHKEQDIFTEKAERNIEALVAQVAVAMDNARLYETAQREAEVQARQAHHAALRADVSAALAAGGSLKTMLQRCVEPLVNHLDAASAHIWTLDEDNDSLLLQASAGLSENQQDFLPKVKDILREKKASFTSAGEETLAFAGYPLLLEDRAVGVVALFARHAITPDTLTALASVADSLAQSVERKQVEQRLAESEARQRGILQSALASVTGGRLRLCVDEDDLPERLPIISERIALTRENLKSTRLRARDAALMVGLDTARINDLLTAVGEATMNAVTHAHEGTAEIRADDDIVQIWVEDKGRGIEMNRLPDATLRHGHSTAGTLGHGFKLMLQTIDRLWLLTGPSGTTVVLEQGREAPLPNWLTEN
jgi:PAS domain S-box-containing protein